MRPWLLYGANGYTGQLIAREAARRGLAPVLAGRDLTKVGALARELGLAHRVFALDRAEITACDLEGMSLVLNCAGPFSATGAPMMDACLRACVHYLDITGEIAVFEQAHARDARAREAGVVLCPGVGFDVVPTDCIAAALKAALPDTTHLRLGFDVRSAISPGTAKTAAEGAALGGRVRRDGRIVRVLHGYRTRRIDFGDGERAAVTIAWGDVSTAYYTTGIPNVEVYAAVPPAAALAMRLGLGDFFGRIMAVPLVRDALVRRAGAAHGPDVEARARQPSFVWGEAENAAGARRTCRMRVANAYDVTVSASLAVVSFLLDRAPARGFTTPSRLMGCDFASSLPGSGEMRVT
ncbi:MAG: saccharopine dehydrogenase NADP-binding domain-containing protein [Acetobacteraceae bacterium]|nr:saccharopine dehydrogenase NADP-binding domain-containing protein [Acetobacteraceae bacterium]